jgi:NTP pyrophosphatase (non-canonical NTP hydrolase)
VTPIRCQLCDQVHPTPPELAARRAPDATQRPLPPEVIAACQAAAASTVGQQLADSYLNHGWTRNVLAREIDIALAQAEAAADRRRIKEVNRAVAESRQRQFGPAIADVLAERHRQDEKWGQQDHDPFTYLAILTEEVGEAAQAALQARFHKESPPGAGSAQEFRQVRLQDFRIEMIHTTAVALAIVQCLDRGIWRWPKLESEE